MNISHTEYWKELEALAGSIAEEAMSECDNDLDDAQEMINDRLLHETIDGHQWVIYYAYNLAVLQHSDNTDYMIDNLGTESAGEVLAEKGLSGLHTALAFWALYADVQDKLEDALQAIADSNEEEEEEEEV